ncbi:tetratricopeptide repeat protein [Brasilonema bromeliae]|uniref:tetratricopeptide repeat protein n=1 Tax=Brasilonema bromeliae TaxID=383615 RepID=UPI00145D148A|nr:tetratricopeptide repeat protein [Brasilonema bromeliae]
MPTALLAFGRVRGILLSLAAIAQELREFDQARKDYQQALKIKIEFGVKRSSAVGNRYSQASTYSTLRYNSKSLPSLGRQCHDSTTPANLPQPQRTYPVRTLASI